MTTRRISALGDEAIKLDDSNFAEVVRGLPAKARMVLAAASKLAHGSLKITMPDGRKVLIGGKGPGRRPKSC